MWSRKQSCKTLLLVYLCPFSIAVVPDLPGLFRIFDPAGNFLLKVLQHQYSRDSLLNFPTNTSWENKLHVTIEKVAVQKVIARGSITTEFVRKDKKRTVLHFKMLNFYIQYKLLVTQYNLTVGIYTIQSISHIIGCPLGYVSLRIWNIYSQGPSDDSWSLGTIKPGQSPALKALSSPRMSTGHAGSFKGRGLSFWNRLQIL